MQDGKQWLTVKEFAAAAGVTVQAVYSRLETNLKGYLKEENGRKYINSDAFQHIRIKADSSNSFKDDSRIIQEDSSFIQEVESPAEIVALDVLTAELDRVRSEVERLRGMLDAEIENRHRAEQAAAVTAAERDAERRRADGLEKQLSTLSDALQREQAIHAGAVRKLLDSAKPETEINAAEAVTVDAVHHNDGIAKRDAVTADVVKHDAPAKRDVVSPCTRPAEKAGKADSEAKKQIKKRKSGLFSSLFWKKSRK